MCCNWNSPKSSRSFDFRLSVCCMFFFTSGKLKRFCPWKIPPWKSWKFHPSNDYSQAEAQRRWTDFPMPHCWPVDEWQPRFFTKLWNGWCVFFLNKEQAKKNGLNDVKCKWHPLLLGSNDLGEQKGKWNSENMSLSTIDTRSWPRIQLFGGLSLEVDMANAKSLESCPLFSYESHRNSRRFKSCHMISLAQRIWHVVKTTISRWVLWKSRDIGGVAF